MASESFTVLLIMSGQVPQLPVLVWWIVEVAHLGYFHIVWLDILSHQNTTTTDNRQRNHEQLFKLYKYCSSVLY